MRLLKHALIALNFFLFFTSVLGQDYYKILGIGKKANDKEIKSAYRQLSKKFHPDKNPDNEEAHNMFIEVGEAYEVLSDSEKRNIYDQHGAAAVKEAAQQQGQQGQQHQDPMNMFHQFFGGGPGGVRQSPAAKFQAELTLNQYFSGAELKFEIPIKTACKSCKGLGGKLEVCQRCQGHGVLMRQFRQGPMIQNIQQQCDACNGRGKNLKQKCKKCDGQTIIQENTEIFVEIPKGCARDFEKVLPKSGDQYPGHEQGDVVMQFHENDKENMGYRRRGKHLYRTEYVSLKEALLGDWEREIDFFDRVEPSITLQRKPGHKIMEGEIEVLQGYGMPFDGEEGDLIIDYHIIMPMGLDTLKKSSNYFDEL